MITPRTSRLTLAIVVGFAAFPSVAWATAYGSLTIKDIEISFFDATPNDSVDVNGSIVSVSGSPIYYTAEGFLRRIDGTSFTDDFKTSASGVTVPPSFDKVVPYGFARGSSTDTKVSGALQVSGTGAKVLSFSEVKASWLRLGVRVGSGTGVKLSALLDYDLGATKGSGAGVTEYVVGGAGISFSGNSLVSSVTGNSRESFTPTFTIVNGVQEVAPYSFVGSKKLEATFINTSTRRQTVFADASLNLSGRSDYFAPVSKVPDASWSLALLASGFGALAFARRQIAA